MNAHQEFDGVTYEQTCFLQEDLPGIFRSSYAIRNFYFTNRIDQYTVCDGDGRALLVDCGNALLTGTAHIDATESELGVPWENAHVHITHFHNDHDGCVPYLLSKGLAKVTTGEHLLYDEANLDRLLAGAGFLEKNDLGPSHQISYLMGCIEPAYDYFDKAIMCPNGTVFEYGRYSFEVLDTPGHTSDHTCLLDRNAGILFAGDHVIDSAPGLMQCFMEEHLLSRYLESIHMLRSLGLEHMLMSHTDSFHNTEQINEFLTALIGKYDRPLRKTLRFAKTAEGFTAYEMAEMYYDRLPGGLAGEPDLRRGRRVIITLAYLECLCDLGILQKEDDSHGVRRYWTVQGADMPMLHEVYPF